MIVEQALATLLQPAVEQPLEPNQDEDEDEMEEYDPVETSFCIKGHDF